MASPYTLSPTPWFISKSWPVPHHSHYLLCKVLNYLFIFLLVFLTPLFSHFCGDLSLEVCVVFLWLEIMSVSYTLLVVTGPGTSL